MRIGKYKFVLYQFVPYEYKTFEDYLSKMASKGWLLVSFNTLYVKFKKIEPMKLKYNVDIMESHKGFDAREYKDFCKASGWNHVCTSNKIQVYSNTDMDATEIETDDETKFKKINKPSFKQTILVTLILAFGLWMVLSINADSGNAAYLSEVPMLVGVTIAGLLVISYAILSCTYLVWFISSKKCLKLGIPINYTSMPYTKFRIVITNITYILMILSVIILLFNKNIAQRNMYLILLTEIILINIIIYKLKNRKSIKKKKTMITIAILAIVMIIMVVGYVSTIASFNSRTPTKKMINMQPLNISDFKNVNINPNYVDIVKTSSPVAEYTLYIDNNFMYELFESKYKWAVNYNMKKIMDTAKKYHQAISKINLGVPSGVQVYFNHKQGSYIFESKDKVLEIQGISGISAQKLASVVYNKVFKAS